MFYKKKSGLESTYYNNIFQKELTYLRMRKGKQETMGYNILFIYVTPITFNIH